MEFSVVILLIGVTYTSFCINGQDSLIVWNTRSTKVEGEIVLKEEFLKV